MDKHRLVQVFDRQADTWDRRRKKRTIDTKWRERLLRDAKGRILEVAVGAGGNFQFYKPDVQVTALDFSPMMIEKAKRASEEYDIPTEFHVGDIETVELPEKAFDTVVSTLSLCAYSDPLRVLQQMNQWCADDGRILLLEHGKSSLLPLTWLQNLLDPVQVRTIGCHINRDILGLVAHSPLIIEKHESHFFGVFHLIWARPSR
ncbi:MAG: class I SAM-dependent methyltransferase [Alicyclobacillus sp.]|nr:class I SAM-dependent methyltransferase [Alicyclobacillus sp.]